MAADNTIRIEKRLDARLLRPILRAYALGHLSSTGPRLFNLIVILIKHKQLLSHDAYTKLLTILSQSLEINRFPAFCGTLVAGSTVLPTVIQSLTWRVIRVFDLETRQANSASIDTGVRFLGALIAAFASFVLLNGGGSDELKFHGLTRVKNAVTGTDRAHTDGSENAAQEKLKHNLYSGGGEEGGAGHDSDPQGQEQYGQRAVEAVTTFHKLEAAADTGSVQSTLARSTTNSSTSASTIKLAGKSMDLTLFALTRALDIVVHSWWARRATNVRQGPAGPTKRRIHNIISNLTDPYFFSVASSIIMWSWFYTPHRLPRAYNSWISSAAQVDHRLIEALREARYGNWVYGKDTGHADLLGNMCMDYDLPQEWGDPAKTTPIPCELVHMGLGKSCEKHALVRFKRGWGFAARMYFPLNALMLLRKWKRLTLEQVVKAILDASRSSAFLGAFIMFFWYGLCAARTRIGPKIFSRKTITPMMWDSGLCVAAGCMACGWSILVEKAARRQEIAFFVLPRAAATVLPRRYDAKHRWREHLAFTVSAAIVLTAAQEQPRAVRGVMGRLLHKVLEV